MADFEPPERLVILKTEHWVLNHRVDSALPGYLVLGARMFTNDLALMPSEALGELRPLLARAQSALNAVLKPEHLYFGRYGHTAGYALHFASYPCAGGSSEASLAIRDTVSFGVSISLPLPGTATTRRTAEN